MKKPHMNAVARTVLCLGGAALMVVTLGGCLSPEQQRLVDMDEDQGTCSSMGARYGSPAYTRCMLQQQERRDDKNLRFLEEARIHSELARNAQEMRDRRRD